MRVSTDGSDGRAAYVIDHQAVFVEGDDVTPDGDASLALALLPAMVRDTTLSLDRPVSHCLAGNLPRLQEIFHCWNPEWSRIDTNHPHAAHSVDRQPGTGAFFTGGVDSFDCVRAHADHLDGLIYVEGFDVALADNDLRGEVRQSLENAAAALDLPLTFVRTNLKQWSKQFVPWAMFHGAALAVVGHSLRNRFGTVLIPSTRSYNELIPWGSHPLTDPLWSGSTEFVHVGAARNRAQKVRSLIDFVPAQETLRVCWRNPGGAYNCGRCEKCLRTMSLLAACGVLDRFTTFPDTLTPANIRGTEAVIDVYAEQTSAMLEEAGLGALATAWLDRLERTKRKAPRLASVRRRVRQVTRDTRNRVMRLSENH